MRVFLKAIAPATRVCALLLLVSSPSAAEDEANGANIRLPKGETLWGVGGAFGFADGSNASHLESFSLVANRVLTAPVGPEWLRGQLAFAVEVVPLFVLTRRRMPRASTSWVATTSNDAAALVRSSLWASGSWFPQMRYRRRSRN